jgi:ABC-type uncharacterized transport system permease subunit
MIFAYIAATFFTLLLLLYAIGRFVRLAKEVGIKLAMLLPFYLVIVMLVAYRRRFKSREELNKYLLH